MAKMEFEKEVTVPLKIDVTDLDSAIEKAKELVNLLDRATELMKEVNTLDYRLIQYVKELLI